MEVAIIFPLASVAKKEAVLPVRKRFVAVMLEEVALVMVEDEALIVPLMVKRLEPLFQRKLADPDRVVAPVKYGTWFAEAEPVIGLVKAV